MTVSFENLDRMLAIWNSTDHDEIAELTAAALEHNIHFVDPNHNIIGRDAFIAMVKQVQARIPHAIYARASDIDCHNNFCRYHWAIHHNGTLLMQGFDVTELSDAGKVLKVIGFFGPLGAV